MRFPPLSHPIHIVMGFIIWAIWFSVNYGGLSLACTLASAPESLGPWSWINILLLAGAFLTAFLLAVLSRRSWTRFCHYDSGEKLSRFALAMAAAVYFSAAIATLAVGLPIMVLPPCL